MKIFTLLIFILFSSTITSAQSVDTVSAFAPDIISQFPIVRDLAISPNGDEAYFTVQSPGTAISVIINIKKENDQWISPVIAHFSGQYFDLEAAFSPDGLQLFFVSNRPGSASSMFKVDFDIWKIERKSLDSEWSKAKRLPTPVNTPANEFYPSVSANGNLYFTSDQVRSSHKDEICMSSFKNGKYEEPIVLSDSINTKGHEFNAFIAPDESYIIYSGYNRTDGMGSGDLYINHRDDKGQWGSAKHLNAVINSTNMDYCPFYDSNNNILYFTSKRNKIKKNKFQYHNLQDLLDDFNIFENADSKIYKVKFDTANY